MSDTSLLCPSPTSKAAEPGVIRGPGFPSFWGAHAPVRLQGGWEVTWMLEEQKGFAVVTTNKLRSNWLLRSPEME